MRSACLLLLVGCGLWQDSQRLAGDAAPSGDSTPTLDVSGDAPPPDGESGTIEVRVFNIEPSFGLAVDFIAPDQTRQRVYTDGSDGPGQVARASSPPNTTVVVYTGYHPRKAHIFIAAQPGDSIVMNRHRREQENYPGFCGVGVCSPITFEMSRHRPTAVHYLQVSCDRGPGNVWYVEEVRPRKCEQAGNATAVAWVADNLSGELLTGASVLRNIDLASFVGGTIRMPKYAAQPTTVTASFVNLPANATSTWGVEYFYAGDPKRFAHAFKPVAPAQNTLQIAAAGDRTQFSLRFSVPGYSELLVQSIHPALLTDYQLDVGEMIRPITNQQFDPATQKITWVNAPFGRPPTLVKAIVEGPYGLGTPGPVLFVYAPGDASSIALPALPPEFTLATVTSLSLQFEHVDGSSYSDALELASSRPTDRPTFWQPEISGTVWSTSVGIDP